MLLGVNVDHVATVRQARGGVEPDPLKAAELALKGGADGITVHLREDRRHIQDNDLRVLRKRVPVEVNLEMAAVREMIGIALRTGPDMVTLVPEKRAELTTEGGIDLRAGERRIRKTVQELQGSGIPVSLFINPSPEDVLRAKKTGARMVEIHTGFYADAFGAKQRKELVKVIKAIEVAREEGLLVNAGHGLTYSNVGKVAAIDGIRGLYIGHSIVSMALYVGMEEAVRRMKRLIRESGR